MVTLTSVVIIKLAAHIGKQIIYVGFKHRIKGICVCLLDTVKLMHHQSSCSWNFMTIFGTAAFTSLELTSSGSLISFLKKDYRTNNLNKCLVRKKAQTV